jgi:transposase-like protein
MEKAKEAKFERWVETAHALVRTSAEQVACPCCGSSSLSVRDIEYGSGHEKGVQRYMTCKCCGAFSGVALRRAGEHDEPVLRAAE